MKVKRAKHSRRVMSFYKFKFGFQTPFNVLIDGTFCQAALKNQINIQEQVAKYLIEPSVLVTTKCVLKELEKIGKEVYGAFFICNQFKVAKCPHTPVRSAAECLSHLARRSKKCENPKYIIATQDDALLEQCRKIGGIPLMSIRYKTLILEPPSEKSVQETDQAAEEIEKVQAMKKEILGEPEEPKKKKKKGPKGPNPLSMKKKQKAVVGARKKGTDEKKKVRRKKKKNNSGESLNVE
uniref:rRNA-processing protein UTP23 n=1 Tax=Panagrolaimus sp. ES5 TaxID=591445 RepID=A0AC34FBB8_9BILA